MSFPPGGVSLRPPTPRFQSRHTGLDVFRLLHLTPHFQLRPDIVASRVGTTRSRNRTVGVRLGKGETLEEILGSMTQVAEGVATAPAVMKLARKYKVSLPVLTAVARILEDGLDPRVAVEEVMNLPQVPEA